MTTDTGLIERALLLPCPFCGKAPVITPDDSYGACMVSCGCEMEPSIAREIGELDEAKRVWNTRALLTELSRAPEAGWVLVPEKPTAEMIEAWHRYRRVREPLHVMCEDAWAAMVAATPTPPHTTTAFCGSAQNGQAATSSSPTEQNDPASPATPPAEARELVERLREVLPLVYGIVHEAWHALDDSEEWSPTEFLITAEHYEELSNLFGKLNDLLDGTDDTTFGWEKPLRDLLAALTAAPEVRG